MVEKWLSFKQIGFFARIIKKTKSFAHRIAADVERYLRIISCRIYEPTHNDRKQTLKGATE